MTTLLEDAINRAHTLSPEAQDDMARLMLAYAGGPVFPETHRRPKDEAIAWIGRDGTKPGRGAARPDGWETLVVHATPAWSRMAAS